MQNWALGINHRMFMENLATARRLFDCAKTCDRFGLAVGAEVLRQEAVIALDLARMFRADALKASSPA